MPTLLQLGLAETVLNAAATTGTVSATYALPARSCDLSWQYFFTTNPSALVMNLQLSNDGNNWQTVDSTTITTGNMRLVSGLAASFVRVNIGSITGGNLVTAILDAKLK